METFINSVKPLPMDQVFYRNVAAPTFYETYYSCGKVPGCGSDHRPVKAIFPGLGGNLEEFAQTPEPTVSGTAKVGKALKASAKGWDSQAEVSFQWHRSGVPILNANKESYTPVAADQGKTLTVQAHGTASGYHNAATMSKATAKVALGTFGTPPTPKVTGTTRVGSTLTVSAGTWSPKPSSLKYQWYVSGKAVKKATSATYKLPASAKGKVVSVKVTAAKAGYTSVSKTVKTVKVAAGVFTKPSTPKITGKAKVGTTLKAGLGTWSPKPSSYKYQWYLNGKKVKGATSSKFKLPKSAKGKRVTVRVAASKSGFKKLYITSGATGKVKK
jgi:hypothetical protein